MTLQCCNVVTLQFATTATGNTLCNDGKWRMVLELATMKLLCSDSKRHYGALQQWQAEADEIFVFCLLDNFKKEKESKKKRKETEL
jgi:hypothetical protein